MILCVAGCHKIVKVQADKPKTQVNSQNRFFSSDLVGYARNHLQSLLGSDIQPIYFKGAQGDIIPIIFNEENRFDACNLLGKSLAETVEKIWNATKTSEILQISSQKITYTGHSLWAPFAHRFLPE